MKALPNVVACLGIVLLMGGPLGQVRADAPTLPLSEILRRHFEAEGVRRGPRPTTVRVTGTIETGGQRGAWTSIETEKDKEWSRTTLGAETYLSGFNGQEGWKQDGNGNVRLFTADELKDRRTDAEAALRAGVESAHITLRPETDRRTGCYILDATPPGGNRMVIYIDPRTFLVTKTQRTEGEETVTTTYDAWQTQDGVPRPTRWTIGNGNKKYDTHVTLTRIETGVDAPDNLFAVPTPVKNYHFLKPGVTSATIPFDYDGSKIRIPVEVNGVPARAALDSGAGGVVLAQPLADLLKLKPAGRFEARGVGGASENRTVTLDALTIGDAVQFTHFSAAAGIDLIGSPSGPLAALLGYDLLSRFVVKIDYANQQMTLTEPDAFQPTSADGTALPMSLDNDMPSVEAQFDGLPPARFLIDTGDPDSLRLSLPYVRTNKLDARYPKGKGRNVEEGGTGGTAEYDVYRARSLQIGGVTIPGIPAYFPRDDKGGASQRWAGTLGAEVLSRFVVTFDYPHRRLFFAPGPAAAAPFDTRTFGIGTVPGVGKDGKLHVFVSHIDTGSPALKAGLRVLDEIEQIDGQTVSTLGYNGVKRLLSVDSGQTSHTLTVHGRKGSSHAIQATIYDLLPSPPGPAG